LPGVSGATIKLDKFGDSEGNFSVLALKKEPFIRDNFSCDYQMLPVGQFLQGETLVSELFVAFREIFFMTRNNESWQETLSRTKKKTILFRI